MNEVLDVKNVEEDKGILNISVGIGVRISINFLNDFGVIAENLKIDGKVAKQLFALSSKVNVI